MQDGSRIARTRLGALMMLGMSSLLIGCASPAGFGTETERSICRELARDLPTYSTSDTPETLASGARFIAVFEAVCGG